MPFIEIFNKEQNLLTEKKIQIQFLRIVTLALNHNEGGEGVGESSPEEFGEEPVEWLSAAWPCGACGAACWVFCGCWVGGWGAAPVGWRVAALMNCMRWALACSAARCCCCCNLAWAAACCCCCAWACWAGVSAVFADCPGILGEEAPEDEADDDAAL